MAESSRETTVRRVLVALESAGRVEPALDAAVALATAFRIQVAAVFVEDINLLRLAALPFAQETGMTSAHVRPFEMAELERTLRWEAARFERALAQAATPQGLQWSFSIARGRPISHALTLSEDADLLVLCQPRGLAAAVSATAAGPVIAVLGGLASFTRVLASALHLADAQQRELSLWLPASSDADFRQRRAQAHEWLSQRGRSARYLALAQPQPLSLAAKLRERGAGALVLANDFAAFDASDIARLLASVTSPIVLVR